MSEYKIKVTISLDQSILTSIDEYGKENGISRSGAISVLTNMAINSFKASNSLNDLMKAIQDEQEKQVKMEKEKSTSDCILG